MHFAGLSLWKFWSLLVHKNNTTLHILPFANIPYRNISHLILLVIWSLIVLVAPDFGFTMYKFMVDPKNFNSQTNVFDRCFLQTYVWWNLKFFISILLTFLWDFCHNQQFWLKLSIQGFWNFQEPCNFCFIAQ